MNLRKLGSLLIFSILASSCESDDLETIAEIDNPIVILDPITENIPSTDSNTEENSNNEMTVGAQNWVAVMQANNGLLESTEQSDFVSLYDNSLAILFYTSIGEFEKAEKTLDFFNSKMDTELLNGSGGFYQFRNKAGENGNRTWLGDNAWLLIAINNYHFHAKNNKYQIMVANLTTWIRSLQDADGGLWGGKNANGTQIHKVTEGIITAFNAVEGYDDFHKNILTYLKNERWVKTENVIVAWPENPTYNYALDLHSLAFGILEGYDSAILENTSRYINTQIATVSTQEITGYCFDEDKDVVWLEGSAQMAIAFKTAGSESEAQEIITEIEKTIMISSLHADTKGVPYASNNATSFGAGMLWDHADLTPAISSTVWYLFAKQNFNPFAVGKNKNIPVSDRFWQ